jgi:hypothetical protein
MRTLDEYRRLKPVTTEAREPPLRAMMQEAVRIEAVTGDAAWDHYNSYVEAALKMAEHSRDSADARLRDPYLVNDEAVRTLKVTITRLEARIDTLREILLLPKLLKERGALARAQIAEMTQEAGGLTRDSNRGTSLDNRG